MLVCAVILVALTSLVRADDSTASKSLHSGIPDVVGDVDYCALDVVVTANAVMQGLVVCAGDRLFDESRLSCYHQRINPHPLIIARVLHICAVLLCVRCGDDDRSHVCVCVCSCVCVQVNSTQDVVTAVAVARALNLTVTVKSGCHDPSSYARFGEMVVDMVGMRKMEIDEDENSVTVQSGLRCVFLLVLLLLLPRETPYHF